jgi:hypothetical protein
MSRMQDHGRYYGPPPERDDRAQKGNGRTRIIVAVVGIAFAVSLAVIVGQRLSDQAISVLAGAVCGVGASIPTSLLVLWAVRRKDQEEKRPSREASSGTYPPVVVVQSPPQMGRGGSHQQTYLPPNVQPMSREFTVVGGEMEELGFND